MNFFSAKSPPAARQRPRPHAEIDGGEVSWRARLGETKAIPIPVPLKGATISGYGPSQKFPAVQQFGWSRGIADMPIELVCRSSSAVPQSTNPFIWAEAGD
jgi:hypothetical protein